MSLKNLKFDSLRTGRLGLKPRLPPIRATNVIVATSYTAIALGAFGCAHFQMQDEQIRMEEQAHFMVWEGKCRRGEALCVDRRTGRLTGLDNPRIIEELRQQARQFERRPYGGRAECDTDSDCAERFGGDGGPQPRSEWLEQEFAGQRRPL